MDSSYDSLPFDKIFGVFVTIRRSQKLDKWPEDIHGCKGNWDNDYQPLGKNKVLETMIDVGKSALYNDNRKNFFPPIQTDRETVVEVDFMLLPTYTVDSEKGFLQELNIQFNNEEFGLIVENVDGRHATYLPHVFPNRDWNFIKNSLLKKSGSKTVSSGTSRYLAYKIIQMKYKLFELKPDNLLYQILANLKGGSRSRYSKKNKKRKSKKNSKQNIKKKSKTISRTKNKNRN